MWWERHKHTVTYRKEREKEGGEVLTEQTTEKGRYSSRRLIKAEFLLQLFIYTRTVDEKTASFITWWWPTCTWPTHFSHVWFHSHTLRQVIKIILGLHRPTPIHDKSQMQRPIQCKHYNNYNKEVYHLVFKNPASHSTKVLLLVLV